MLKARFLHLTNLVAQLQIIRERQLVATKIAMFNVFHEMRDCRINHDSLNIISHANPYSISRSTMMRPIKCATESYRSTFLPYGTTLSVYLFCSSISIRSSS